MFLIIEGNMPKCGLTTDQKVGGSSPSRQFERFSKVATEIEELIYLRFKRDADNGEPDFETRMEAKLASEIVAVAFRVSMVANGPAAMPGNLGGEFNIPVLFHKVLDRLHPKD